MFTGIIECLGEVTALEPEGTNLHITISSPISQELKIDQSVTHNGACLTVVDVKDFSHTVTAIDETMQRTNLGQLKTGSKVNLERAMLAGSRFDGHIVQGHVDQQGTCLSVTEKDGSWEYWFGFDPREDAMVVEKGSICIDGVSLTVVDAEKDRFSVAIIPYTYEHTCFQYFEAGTKVNLEFDIIGKYLAKQFAAYKPS